MGALVTLNLPADSRVRELPWVITIGSLDEDDEWEPVVCGPYERAHALSLAQAVVADEQLMAVVEPLLPLADVEAIRDEIELARAAAEAEPNADDAGAYASGAGPSGVGPSGVGPSGVGPSGVGPSGVGPSGVGPDAPAEETRRVPSIPPPDESEVRAGFARIAALLTAGRP